MAGRALHAAPVSVKRPLSYGPCREYLEAVYGEAVSQHQLRLVSWALDTKVSETYDNPASCAAALVTATQRTCAYVHAGLTREWFSGAVRPSVKDVVAIPGLWADVDYRDAVHKALNLPPNLMHVLGFLLGLPLRPSVVVHTGHGALVWWLFREPWVFEVPEERAQAGDLCTRWQAYLRTRLGYALDATSDLARLTRPAGVLNRKMHPVPTSVIWETASRYDVADFEDVGLPELAPAIAPDKQREEEGPPARLVPIFSGCSWLRHCYVERATLPEPEWHAMLSIVGRCEDGPVQVQRFSEGHPEYGSIETAAKARRAIHSAGPRTCAWISRATNDRYCADCPAKLLGLRSPIVMGRIYDGEID